MPGTIYGPRSRGRASLIAGAGLLTVLGAPALLGGCGVLKCGDGTVQSDGACVPAVMAAPEPAISVKVTSLQVDHSASSPVYVHHPIRVSVGLTSTGKKSLVALSVALVEKGGTGKGCYLGGGDAVLAGTGDEQTFDYEFLVPQICASGDYNVAIGFDSTGGAPPLKDNFLVFSPENSESAVSKACKGRTPEGDAAPCSYALKVGQSPGLDYTMALLEPLSNVGVVYVDLPNGPDGTLNKLETPIPFLRVNWAATTLGKDIDAADGEKHPSPLTIRYYMRAVKDQDNIGWKLLNFGPAPDPENPNKLINPTVRAVADFRPGLKYQVSNNLYLVDEFTRFVSGAWRTEEEFLIRGCLETALREVGDPVYAGADGKGNNCREFSVRVVRALQPVQSASSLAFNSEWGKEFGNESTFKFAVKTSANNTIDLSGAHMALAVDSYVKSKLLGADLTLVKASANAEALVSLLGSHVDASVQAYTYTLFSFSKTFKDAYTWQLPSWNMAKMYGVTFRYYAIPLVNVDVTFSAAGSVGLDANLGVESRAGAGAAPFNTSQKIGLIKGAVTPRGKLSAVFDAKAAALGFTAKAAGELMLVDVASPLTASLAWGLTSVKPTLTVVGDVKWHLDVASGAGKVDVSVATPKIPFIGVKTGTWNLVQMEPNAKSYDLLVRQATLNIGQ